MKTYIGAKIINAEPMSKGAFLEEKFSPCGAEDFNLPGYKVTYPDGYTSWSPKDVFEEAYRQVPRLSPEEIARVAHEVNRAYCQSLGDESQPAWEDAPDWQKSSAINGVRFHLANPDAGPDHSHNEWLKEKEANGWKYGPVKDPEKKEHPCYVPYEVLPPEQKAKDFLFRGVVQALAGLA